MKIKTCFGQVEGRAMMMMIARTQYYSSGAIEGLRERIEHLEMVLALVLEEMPEENVAGIAQKLGWQVEGD